MFCTSLIRFLALLFLTLPIPQVSSTQAQSTLVAFNPLPLVQMYQKYREKKKMSEKLEHIQRNLAELKSDINLLINSHLKSALTALDDAQHMVNDAEKIDSIRSAKHFLTQAINIEKEPQRKALAIYLLGHVYLLLDEQQAAKRQLINVVRFQFGQTQGIWKKTTIFDPKITQLKVDATGILCAFNDKATAIKENWCALHVGYRGAASIALKDLERCVASEETTSCERVGYRLLKTYIDQNRAENIQDPLSLRDPFKEEHYTSVNIGKDFLFESCELPSKGGLPSIDHYHACYWRAQVLLHQRDYAQLLQHHRFLCEHWLNSRQQDVDDAWSSAVETEAVSACQALYKEPMWSKLSKEDKASYVRPLCLQGDRIACAQLIRDTHFYHLELRNDISTYVGQRCLIEEDQTFCRLVEDTLKHELEPMIFKLKEIVIGLNPEGKLWDMTGDSNPEILLTMRIGKTLIYHQQLSIESISTDASGNPLSYRLRPEPSQSLPVYLGYAKRHKLELTFTDLDAYDDDLIGAETLSYSDFKGYDASFGSVKRLSVELTPVTRP